MNATLIVPIVLGLIGIVFLFSIIFMLLSPFISSLGDLRLRWAMRSRSKVVSELDLMLAKHEEERALTLIQDAFEFSHLPSSPVALKIISDYNAALFDRLVRIIQIKGAEPESLEIVARLMDLHAELLKARILEKKGARAFLKRRSDKGKSAPTWAIDEVKKRVFDLEQRLDVNRTSLAIKLRELCVEIIAEPNSEEIIYH